MMKWLRNNIKFIISQSWKCSNAIFAVIGLAGMLANLDSLIFPDLKQWVRVLIGIGILFAIWFCVFFLCAIHYYRKEKVCILNVTNDHHVYAQYGDIFDCDTQEKIESKTKRNIIIPGNCCFDTIIDDDLVSSQKLQGQALQYLFETGSYTQETLNQFITNYLGDRKIPYTQLNKHQKRKGNLRRYPIGTIVKIPTNNDEIYWFIALTEFDENLHASIPNRAVYINCLQTMIDSISNLSQGYATYLPVIGGGLPEVSDNEQTILELIVKLLKINKDKINCDIHIVVRTSGKDDISIYNLG